MTTHLNAKPFPDHAVETQKVQAVTKTCIACGSTVKIQEVSDQAPHPVLKLCEKCRNLRKKFEAGAKLGEENIEGEETWNYEEKDLEALVKALGYFTKLQNKSL